MTLYLSRLRDAWAVLTGHKVAVGPTWQYVTFTSNGSSLVYNGGFTSGPTWTVGNSSTR
jgi:hypothetical protein